MCRLFGLHAGAPVRATFWLLDAPDSLRAQSHRAPDGAGIGTFDPEGNVGECGADLLAAVG
jgi:predicted glutamine amidotransferase